MAMTTTAPACHAGRRAPARAGCAEEIAHG